MDINPFYHSLFCGTNDGSLIICSLSSGSVTRIFDLEGCKPIKILSTKEWGFILLYLTEIVNGKIKHKLSLYTINGDLIRSVLLNYGI